jgi:hypothetical protein
MVNIQEFIKIPFVLVVFCFFYGSAYAEEKTGKEKEIYVFIVSSSAPASSSVPSLKYADDDAALYYEFFKPVAKKEVLFTSFDRESAKIYPELVSLAKPPKKKDVIENYREMLKTIKEIKGVKKEIFLIFIGHGGIDESHRGFLNLADGKLFKDEIDSIFLNYEDNQTIIHFIIDSCNAYYLIQKRGDWKEQDTYVDLSRDFQKVYTFEYEKRMSNIGFLISSAGMVETYEWDYIHSGVFSYLIRSGLLGAADINGDSIITYGELRAFLASANAGIKVEKAKPKYLLLAPRGHDDTGIVDLKMWKAKGSSFYTLGSSGRFSVEDDRGVKILELNVGEKQKFSLLLPQEKREYFLIPDKDEKNSLKLKKQGDQIAAFSMEGSELRKRGAYSESLLSGLFAVPFTKEFYQGFAEGYDREILLMRGREPEKNRILYQIGAANTISYPLFDLSGVENGVNFKGILPVSGNIYFGPELGATYSSHKNTSGDFTLYRIYTGLFLGAMFDLRETIIFYLETGFSPQWIIHDTREKKKGDNLSFRTKMETGLSFIMGNFALRTGFGGGLNVITLDGREDVFIQPYAILGANWIF